MVEDLMAIVHTFSGRLYGLRKYHKAIKEDFPEYTLGAIKEPVQ
jgi:predicted site-specific integrase-resolvase